MKTYLLIIFLQIFNLTSYEDVKDDIEIGLNYFKIESIQIIVKYGNDNKVLAGDGFYEIRLEDDLNHSWRRKKILIHEIVHINQHYTGEFKFLDDRHIEYKGIRYLRSDKNPPWEIDAKQKTNKILRLN